MEDRASIMSAVPMPIKTILPDHEDISIPEVEWEYLYIINLYVDVKVPGLPMFEKDFKVLCATLDTVADTMLMPPIVGVFSKFSHQLSESELIEFIGGISEALDKRHVDQYRVPEIAHVERRVKDAKISVPETETKE